ncbi:MAG: cold shock domain-containing protein [Cyanobacteria bacterium P01_F01_bin.150]
MSPNLRKGKLLRWNEQRGFGFIESEDDSRGVFLHISALGNIPRPPKVGDIIYYRRVVQADGRAKAEQASIQGLSPRNSAKKRSPASKKRRTQKSRQRRPSRLLQKLGGLGILLLGVAVSAQFQPSTSPPPLTAISRPDCKIKGNISISSGRRWYHMPGMEDYSNTVISPDKGERWFCSEAEAIAAGWKKAPK